MLVGINVGSIDFVVEHFTADPYAKPTNAKCSPKINLDAPLGGNAWRGRNAWRLGGKRKFNLSAKVQPADLRPDAFVTNRHSLPKPPTRVNQQKGIRDRKLNFPV